jgi:hypothetical protein
MTVMFNKIIDKIIDTNLFNQLFAYYKCKQIVTVDLSYDLFVAFMQFQCNVKPDIQTVDSMVHSLPCRDKDLFKWMLYDSGPHYCIRFVKKVLKSNSLTSNKSAFYLLFDSIRMMKQVAEQVQSGTFVSIENIYENNRNYN